VEHRREFDLVLIDKQNYLMKYENSILWSPKFTPVQFYWTMAWVVLAFSITFYIFLIAQPRNMLKYKQKYGIKFK
jgi:hypothetical protein